MIELQSEVLNAFDSLRPPEPLPIGSQAPDFEHTDIKGEVINLSNYAGREVVLVFSSTTCPACQMFWPTLQQFHESNRNLQIIMISRGNSEETESMKNDHSFDFPIIEWDEQLAEKYLVPGTPYIYLISKDQKIAFVSAGDQLHLLEKEIQ